MKREERQVPNKQRKMPNDKTKPMNEQSDKNQRIKEEERGKQNKALIKKRATFREERHAESRRETNTEEKYQKKRERHWISMDKISKKPERITDQGKEMYQSCEE